mmetsp:Transcript_25621/g.71599  ORF Transcript_25621/g.71599 Transcript_25621/m.71599 type:complete len:375 (-) Transcript_25621:155-1279(-)
MLDLVVQPSVHEVDEVGSHAEIDGGQDLSQEEGSRVRAARLLEAVHVIPGVVGGDGEEGVEVGEDLGEEEVPDGVLVHHGAGVSVISELLAEEVEGDRREEEVDEEVRAEDDGEELPTGVEDVVLREDVLEGDRRLRLDALGDRLALAAHLGELELLVGVGGVVKPLPGGHQEDDVEVLEEVRSLLLAQGVHVVLHEIGVVDLAEVVVVTGVVLDVPGLGHHPVKPVIPAPPQGGQRELEARPAALALRVALLVAAVAGVVGDHGPSGKDVQRDADDGKDVDGEAHGHEAEGRAHVGPHDHAVQVGHVLRPLRVLELLAQGADLLVEAVVVEVLDPFVVLFLHQLGVGLVQLGLREYRGLGFVRLAHLCVWCDV